MTTSKRFYSQIATYLLRLDRSPSRRGFRLDNVKIEVDLEAKVAFLRDPGSYPGPPDRVESIETHMAWVFLAGPFAYKLKKPVRFDYLDFSTPELRREDCEKEVRLNRRLAAGVYLGTLPLCITAEGCLQLGGVGSVVDWLVQMRRLPTERMLDVSIREGTFDEEDIRRVARVLSDFYTASDPEKLSPVAYRRQFREHIETNASALKNPSYHLPRASIDTLISRQLTLLEKNASLFDRRALDRRIVEGHGDLRPDHICLASHPVIFDCLEFKRAFRIIDPADELAFLSMECERLGAPQIGTCLFDEYTRQTGDHPPELLVRFYKSYRSCLRARLCAQHLDDTGVDKANWIARANTYLELGLTYLVDQ